jgi:5-methylcytosine-specific restriction endonuclease McrA
MKLVLPDLSPRPVYKATFKVASRPLPGRTNTRKPLKSAPCPYCGETMWNYYGDHPKRMTRDHIVPTARGGKYHDWVMACSACNNSKGSLLLNEWRLILSLRNKRLYIFAYEKLIPRAILNYISPVLHRLAYI